LSRSFVARLLDAGEIPSEHLPDSRHRVVRLADVLEFQVFPGCPPQRVAAISRHTGTRSSGRVGRSAAGRAFDPDAVTRAVLASVRHEDTAYDELLMAGVPRDEARERIRTDIDQVVERWRRPA